MPDQLEGEDLSRATAVAMGWVPPSGEPGMVRGSLWHTLASRQPDGGSARREGGGWWVFSPPDYLLPITDEEKLRWLSDRLSEFVPVRVRDGWVTAYVVGNRAGRSSYFRGEGRTLSEALCRLIVAVGGGRG